MKFLLISSLNFQAISSTMYKHQKQALHWMIKRENGDQLPPFWENKNGQYFNSVTIFTTKTKPRSVCGGTVMSTSWVLHKGFYHDSSPWLNLFGLSWWTSFAMVKIKSCHVTSPLFQKWHKCICLWNKFSDFHIETLFNAYIDRNISKIFLINYKIFSIDNHDDAN